MSRAHRVRACLCVCGPLAGAGGEVTSHAQTHTPTGWFQPGLQAPSTLGPGGPGQSQSRCSASLATRAMAGRECGQGLKGQ